MLPPHNVLISMSGGRSRAVAGDRGAPVVAAPNGDAARGPFVSVAVPCGPLALHAVRSAPHWRIDDLTQRATYVSDDKHNLDAHAHQGKPATGPRRHSSRDPDETDRRAKTHRPEPIERAAAIRPEALSASAPPGVSTVFAA